MNQRGVYSFSQSSYYTSFRPKKNVQIWRPRRISDEHSQGTSEVTASPSSTPNTASTAYPLTENNIVTDVAPLSDIFTRKLRLSGKDVPSSSKSTIVGSLPEEKPYESLEEMEVDSIANLLPDEDELFSGLFDDFGYNFDHAGGGGMELESENFTSVNRTSGVDGLVRNFGVDGDSKRRFPLVKEPTETLFVRNFDILVGEFELKAIFEECGKIQSFYTGCKKKGFVMVTYYDIMTAQHAMRTLQRRQVRSRKLDIHYALPKGFDLEAFSPTFHSHYSLPKYQGSSAKGNFSSTIRNKTVNIGTRGTCEYEYGRHIQGMSSTGNAAEFNGGGFPGYGVYYMWNSSNMHQQPSSFPQMSSFPSTMPLQLGQTLHGRPPMSSMSMFDSNNERMRSLHHQKSGANTNNVGYKKQYELDLGNILCGLDTRTTLMIRNIPNKYTLEMLMEVVNRQFEGDYDFLYLPIDFKYKCNVGYAFINMVNPIKILYFHQAFNGKKWEKFNSDKVVSLSYARIQGRGSLIDHFKKSSVMNEDKAHRPLFHTHGPNVANMESFPISLGNQNSYHVGSAGSGNMGTHGEGSSSAC